MFFFVTLQRLHAPKTNMETKNRYFVDVSPFAKGIFSGSMLVSAGVCETSGVYRCLGFDKNYHLGMETRNPTTRNCF